MKSTQDKMNNDELLGLLIHSYNNHLAAMMGFTEIVLLDHPNNSIKEKLDLVIASGNEAVELGKGILTAIGRLQIVKSPIRIDLLTKEIAKINKSDIDSFEINEVGFNVNTNLILFVECVSDLVRFVNEYSTGITTNKKAKLHFKLIDKNNIVELRIEANGIELLNEEIEQLFNPFFSSRQMQGTKDLGLAKAKGFFQQM